MEMCIRDSVPHGPGGGDGLLLFPQAAYRLDLIPDLGRPLKFHGFRRPDHVLGELFDDRLGMPFQKAAYALQQGMVSVSYTQLDVYKRQG